MTRSCPTCGLSLIHDVAIVLAGPDHEERGLLGWASAVIGSFRVDGLAIRRTLGDGCLTVSWPSRRGHTTVIPVDPDLFKAVETSVIQAYLNERAKRGRRPA